MIADKQKIAGGNEVYAPLFFRLNNNADRVAYDELMGEENVSVHDEIEGQLRELIKSNSPSVKIREEAYPALIGQHLQGREIHDYGVWVFYPWSRRMVHLLDEAEFIEVRTNRNRYKITREEQALLLTKKVGVIGLSVGQSIALTIAMERTCGELRLADFDTAELSNLNRIRTGVHNLGIRKTVIAAREISEIDPFIKVRIFNAGLTSGNIDSFFCENGQLDALVEVCDGLDIKIVSRFKARELRVPVIMDTNDRGMLDVERFDLEPERPILHGLAGDLDPTKIHSLTNEQKIPYILKMIGAETISTRLKASMLEVEQSINTWPQLASSVALGGAITTDVCRNIFLGRFHDSGRYYIDIDEMIKDKAPQDEVPEKYPAPPELTFKDLELIAREYGPVNKSVAVSPDKIKQIVSAAHLAPSGGNAQPWKFLLKDNALYIFHDAFYSHSLLDYKNFGSYVAFGAMLENIELKAATLDVSVSQHVFPLKNDNRLVAVVAFEEKIVDLPHVHLASVIDTRMTNRNVTERKLLQQDDCAALIRTASTIPQARLQLFDSPEHIKEFAEILTNAERLRFLHPRGHYDTFVKELRFTSEEVQSSSDGLDVKTLNMSESDIAALTIARDPSAIAFLHDQQKGAGFKKISAKNVHSASAIGVITMDGSEPRHFLQGGRSLERVWLESNYRRISLQPIAQIIFMTALLKEGVQTAFNSYEQHELLEINNRLSNILDLSPGRNPIFVFRLCQADTPEVRSLRRPLEKVFFSARTNNATRAPQLVGQ